MSKIFQGEDGEALRAEFQMWWETLILPRLDRYWSEVYELRKKNSETMTSRTPHADLFKLVIIPDDIKDKQSPGVFNLKYTLPDECGWAYLDAILAMYMFLRPDLFPRVDVIANAILNRIFDIGMDIKTSYCNFSPETHILLHQMAVGTTETLQSFQYTAGIAVQLEMLRQIQTIESRSDFKESDLLEAVKKLIQKEIDDKIPDKSKQELTDQLSCLKL